MKTYKACFGNFDIIDTPGINVNHGKIKAMLMQVLPTSHMVLFVVESLQFTSDNIADMLTFILANSTCQVIVLVNKIDFILVDCLGATKVENKKSLIGFKEFIAQDKSIEIEVIANPLDRLLQFEKRFENNQPTMMKVKTYLKLYFKKEIETSRLRIISSTFSLNCIDVHNMKQLMQFLPEIEKKQFGAQIWTPDDVVEFIRTSPITI